MQKVAYSTTYIQHFSDFQPIRQPGQSGTACQNQEISNLQADIQKRIAAAKSDWIMNGFTDADWDQLQKDLEAYGLEKYLSIFQKYVDEYYK